MRTRLNVVVERITPEMAKRYLESSSGNRSISNTRIRLYCTMMRHNQWKGINGEVIKFDREGHLIDGHHRLLAVLMSGLAYVEMAVWRDIEADARGTLDTGRARPLSVILSLEHPNLTNITSRVAYLRLCAYLATGRNVPILAEPSYDEWVRPYKAGIEWAVGTLVGDRVLRTACIAGSLAFAHRTSPEKIEEFGSNLVSQVGLKPGAPEIAVWKALRNYTPERRRASTGTPGRDMSRKVLNAVLASVEGRSLAKLQDGDKGLDYFREVYDTRAVNNITEAWVAPPEEYEQDEDSQESLKSRSFVIGGHMVHITNMYHPEARA